MDAYAGAPASTPAKRIPTGGTDADSQTARYLTNFSAFSPSDAVPSDGSGGTNEGQLPPAQAIIAPFGTSTTCGDAIVGKDELGRDEECDDGNEGADGCTAHCQTRDQAVATATHTDRYLGAGRHPISGSNSGFINTYVEFPDGNVSIGATLFNIWGQPGPHVDVSAGASPLEESNPVAAALPSGAYAVAWGDFDGDGSDLGVALRKVNADGSLGALSVANASHEFSQLNPDILLIDDKVIVAWEDYSEAFNGPDLRYRFFDRDLNPTSGDLTLASSALPEAAVSLATFNGSWAAAYREGTADGKENVVVRVGQNSFRLSTPVWGGSPDDRPALVGLDATHLLVVFSAGTDPGATGVFNIPRLRYAVIDTTSAAAPTWQSLDPRDDVFSTDTSVAQLSPAVVRGEDGVYLSWRSEARPGDAAGDQIWLKYASWNPGLETPLDLREPEMLVPRLGEGNFADQRTPQLAYVPASMFPPGGMLAIAWDDYSHSQGVTAGDPDVVAHYAPLRPRAATGPQLVTQNWTGTTGAPWPANWTVAATANTQVTISGNAGKMLVSGNGTAVGVPNDHTALDVDMVTKVTWNLNQATGGLIAREADSDADTYLVASFGPVANESFRIYGILDGVATSNIGSAVAFPFLFVTYAQEVQFLVRFRVANDSSGNIAVSSKLWPADVPEPAGWTVQGTLLASSALGTRIANRPGRFGVWGGGTQSGRSATFDDFRGTFYEGSTHGDPSVPAPSAPLSRDKPLYRRCTPGHQCTVAEGTCFDNAECAPGTTCQSAQSEWLGVGSDANTCTTAHCGDKTRNADEPRVDCGGSACAPCTCPLTLSNGVSGYCTTTSNCLCGIGEGACNSSSQCLPGLACKGAGLQYGVSSGATVCTPFHCLNRVIDTAVGETGIDCGGDCGSCSCGAANGSALHCRVYCPCASGNGSCRWDDECQPGLVCGLTTSGAHFGLAAGTQACVKAHCKNNAKDADETSVDCGGADCGTICP